MQSVSILSICVLLPFAVFLLCCSTVLSGQCNVSFYFFGILGVMKLHHFARHSPFKRHFSKYLLSLAWKNLGSHMRVFTAFEVRNRTKWKLEKYSLLVDRLKQNPGKNGFEPTTMRLTWSIHLHLHVPALGEVPFYFWLFLLRWPHTPYATSTGENTEDSHNTEDSIPYSFRIVSGFFNVPQGTYQHKRYLWDGA